MISHNFFDLRKANQAPLINKVKQHSGFITHKKGAFLSLLLILPSLHLSAKPPCEEAPCEDEDIEIIYRNAITNTIWENQETGADFYQSPYNVSLFSAENGEDSERLWSQTKSIAAYGFGVIGVLYALPSSITNWDKDSDDFFKWRDNVKQGPVWDRDDFVLNYVGHPYFGGVYYQAARKSGYRQWDAFLYSFMMSTFYWEYGIEAFAEIPSIQDIVVTPVLGWVYGEWAFNKEQDIRRNGSTVMDSEFLGTTALFFLDPIDSMGRGINNLFNAEVVKAGTGYISMKEVPIYGTNKTESYVQFNISYTLGDGGNVKNSGPSYYQNTQDPVDYSIVGLGFGTGYVDLDEGWQLDNDQVVEFSLGLYFSRSFSSRLSYATGNFDQTNSQKSHSYENYSLNGQYYFNTEEAYRPYFTAGFGEMMRDKDRERKTFQVHVGAGMHFKITNNLAFQTDYRRYHSTQADRSENAFTANFIYRLGKGEWY